MLTRRTLVHVLSRRSGLRDCVVLRRRLVRRVAHVPRLLLLRLRSYVLGCSRTRHVPRLLSWLMRIVARSRDIPSPPEVRACC